MPEFIYIILLALLAGAAMPIGAVLARADLLHPAFLEPRARHFIVAFGGGALVSAVALVLVPEGASQLSVELAVLCFSAGGLFFYCLTRLVTGPAAMCSGQVIEPGGLASAFD